MPAIPRSRARWARLPAPVTLVQTEEDVARLDLPTDTPIAYVTQTTLSVDDTGTSSPRCSGRFRDVVGPETSDICYATQNRQTAVRDLCRRSTSCSWSAPK